MEKKYLKYKAKYYKLRNKINVLQKGGNVCNSIIKYHNLGSVSQNQLNVHMYFMNKIINSSANYINSLTFENILLENYGKDVNGKLNEKSINGILHEWRSKLSNPNLLKTTSNEIISDHVPIGNPDFFSWNVMKNAAYLQLKNLNHRNYLDNDVEFLLSNIRRVQYVGNIVKWYSDVNLETNHKLHTVICLQECDLSVYKGVNELLSDKYCSHFIPRRIFSGENNVDNLAESKVWIQEDGIAIFVKNNIRHDLTLMTWNANPNNNIEGMNTRNILIELHEGDKIKNVIVTHNDKKEDDLRRLICSSIGNNRERELFVVGDTNHTYSELNSRLQGVIFHSLASNNLDHIIKVDTINSNCEISSAHSATTAPSRNSSFDEMVEKYKELTAKGSYVHPKIKNDPAVQEYIKNLKK